MIEEQYVSFEVAKLLKEKGFNQETYAKYATEVVREKWYDDYRERVVSFNREEGELIESLIGKEKYELYGNVISAPTQQMAMKWLREIHLIFLDFHLVLGEDKPRFRIGVYQMKDEETYVWKEWIFGDSYEESYEAAIKYCLEYLIKGE